MPRSYPTPEKGWDFGLAVYPEDGGSEKEILKTAQERLNQEGRQPLPAGARNEPPAETPAGEERQDSEPGNGFREKLL